MFISKALILQLSELGRYPYYFDIIKAMPIEHLHPNTLLYNALQCSKNIGVSGNSWYDTLSQLSNFLDLPLSNLVSMKRSTFHAKLTKALKAKYLNEWHAKRRNVLLVNLITIQK